MCGGFRQNTGARSRGKCVSSHLACLDSFCFVVVCACRESRDCGGAAAVWLFRPILADGTSVGRETARDSERREHARVYEAAFCASAPCRIKGRPGQCGMDPWKIQRVWPG